MQLLLMSACFRHNKLSVLMTVFTIITIVINNHPSAWLHLHPGDIYAWDYEYNNHYRRHHQRHRHHH